MGPYLQLVGAHVVLVINNMFFLYSRSWFWKFWGGLHHFNPVWSKCRTQVLVWLNLWAVNKGRILDKSLDKNLARCADSFHKISSKGLPVLWAWSVVMETAVVMVRSCDMCWLNSSYSMQMLLYLKYKSLNLYWHLHTFSFVRYTAGTQIS